MKFAVDFEANSNLTVLEPPKELVFRHPDGAFEVYIMPIDHEVKNQPPLILLRIFFDAPDINEAAIKWKEHATESLNALSFVTRSKFKFRRALKIVDCTPGLHERDAIIFTAYDPSLEFEPAIDAEFMDAAALILGAADSLLTKRAMRWFRLGVNADNLEDQFQYFWLAIELIAEGTKGDDKIRDRCQKCGGDLFCHACNDFPTHRRYKKQAIRELIHKIVTVEPEKAYSQFDKVRNALFHGARIQDIEDHLHSPFDRIVHLLGQVAWAAIFTSIASSLDGKKLAVGEPNTYARPEISALLHIKVHVPMKTNGEPEIEKFPKFDVSLEAVPDHQSGQREVGR